MGRRWPVDSSGDQRQGGLGRGARATRRGGKTARGTSEMRAHRRGSFHGGTARSEGNGGGGGVRWWCSVAHGLGRWSGHRRSLGWHQRSGRAGCSLMAGGVRRPGKSGCGGGSKRILVEEAVEAWPA
jgi:hypothetical protein